MKNVKQINAYFVVEAALILPAVISALLLTVSLFVFQYDRCLLEQDMAMQAVKGAAAKAQASGGTTDQGLSGEESAKMQSEEELEEKMRLQTAQLYRNKYVAWDLVLLELKLKKGVIEASGEGEFRFPLPGWNLWNHENTWNAKAEYKAHRIAPVDFIRNCRKVKGGN